MKSILNTCFFVAIVFFSCNMLHAQIPSKKQDSIINSLVVNYKEKLALTGKQEVLFKEKLQTFYLRKEELRSELDGKNKLRTLYELGKEESAEMRDVLTREQHDLYRRIKPSLQPLEELSLNKSVNKN